MRGCINVITSVLLKIKQIYFMQVVDLEKKSLFVTLMIMN